jgi:hypothetical protein
MIEKVEASRVEMEETDAAGNSIFTVVNLIDKCPNARIPFSRWRRTFGGTE